MWRPDAIAGRPMGLISRGSRRGPARSVNCLRHLAATGPRDGARPRPSRYAMDRDITYGQRKQPCGELKPLRARLAYHDTTGVDRDIEQLIGLLQQRHGYT